MYEFQTGEDEHLEKIIDFAKRNFTEQLHWFKDNLDTFYKEDYKYYSQFDPKEPGTLPSTYIENKLKKPEPLLVIEILSDIPFHLNAKIPIELKIDELSVKLITDHRKKTILVRHWNNLLYICEIRSIGICDWASSIMLVVEPQTIIPNNLQMSVPHCTIDTKAFGLKIREFRDFDYLKVKDEMQKSDYFSRVSSLLPSCGISRSDFNVKMQVNQVN